MAIYGNPKENRVCVNWLKKNEKCTKYFRKFGNKKLSFIGTEDNKKDAEKIKKFREDRYDKKTKIVKFGGEYLIYSH